MKFRDEDELPHAPQDDPHWQESVWVQWFDLAAGVGGFHRIGHHPTDGTAVVWCGVVTEDGERFRRSDAQVPLGEQDRDARFGAGPGQVIRPEGGTIRVEVREPECELDLTFVDFYPVAGLWSDEETKMSEKVAAGHYESSGRVTGSVRLGSRTWTVDGLGHRDHSWGVRRWDYVLSHRFFAGTCGPTLSFSGFTWHAADGSFFKGGFVVRDGRPVRAEDLDIVVHMEPDALTHRGGEATFRLPGGEELRIACETVDGVVFSNRGVWSFESACRFRAGELAGTCNLEMTNNPRRGTEPPTLAVRGALADGLTRREVPPR